MTDDLLARLQSLSPEERARLLAQLGVASSSTAFTLGSGVQTGDVQTGDITGRDVREGVEGDVTLSDDARLNGVAVGVNLGTIIYGRDPSEEERRQLAWYLGRLAARMGQLSLRGLATHLDEGRSALTLERVYVTLAVQDGLRPLAEGSFAQLQVYFAGDDPRGPLAQTADPDYALPHAAVVLVGVPEQDGSGEQGAQPEVGAAPETMLLYRSTLLTELVGTKHQPRTLLGDPGSGKSTFLRHLAWAVASRGLDQPFEELCLFGWPPDLRLLPVVISLRALAGRLARDGSSDTTVRAALRDEIAAYGIGLADTLLSAAIHRGAALLLFDGLDEVPTEMLPGRSADRHTTLRAVRDFLESCPPQRALVTCRTRAFDDSLRAIVSWGSSTIAPLSLGQIRHFVPAWYGELHARGLITADQVERLAGKLVDTIVGSGQLRQMAGTPLLLTMMALVLLDAGELPKDRPQLYERVLRLLLGQWDQLRDGQSLSDAIGLSDWGGERIQPLLDRLSYQAHRDASSEDGRGRLGRGQLYTALIDFFRLARVPAPGDTALRCLDYIEERSGLLVPDGADTYVFAHLTLQEYCVGRHIALNSDDPVSLAMEHRAADRWREPILLAAGLMRPAELQGLLADLIDAEGKALERWQRDLILAAEIGEDRDWNYLRTWPAVKVDRLQRDLRAGLVALLADRAQSLPAAERVRAGFLLGDLGDPRFPVTVEEWRSEVERALAGDTTGYFCRVEAGTYWIGSTDDDPEARDVEKPRHQVTFDSPFFIARYPITNAQWEVWGVRSSYFADDINLNRPNQPIVGLEWEWCNEFCIWMNEQVDAVIRLPSEQEWEVASRFDTRLYPWGNTWYKDYAATAEDRKARNWQSSVPIGCYPKGAAPCGVFDMAGNVREWTSSTCQPYPGAWGNFAEQHGRVIRGGGFNEKGTKVRCAARSFYLFNYSVSLGFRIVLDIKSV